MMLVHTALFVLAVVTTPVGYEPAREVVPPAHWALIRQIDLTAKSGHGASFADGRIEVPLKPAIHILVHEIGHAVARSSPQLETEHTRLFVRPSDDPHESFAEGYRGTLTGTPCLSSDESSWYRSRVLSYRPLPLGPVLTVQSETVQTFAARSYPSSECRGIVSGVIVAGCNIVPEGSIR